MLTAVPYETHPAPAQLTMPDFSKSLGGWGSGQAAGNVNFTLFVFEEYGDGSVSTYHGRHDSKVDHDMLIL